MEIFLKIFSVDLTSQSAVGGRLNTTVARTSSPARYAATPPSSLHSTSITPRVRVTS